MTSPPPLVANLRAQLGARLIETHISWLLVTASDAYKIKKPVNLGFLDFSSLERRHHFCEEEIRLNRRLAPDIYLDVQAITGQDDQPHLGGASPVLDWAVHMRAFDPDSTLDRSNVVRPAQIDAIAHALAAFHQRVPSASTDSDYGTPASVCTPAEDNFEQIRALNPPAIALNQLGEIAAWSRLQGQRLDAFFTQRRQSGHVRECHGDLHLGNIAWRNGQPLIFDCIEFNPSLRFIDVINEAAFLCMDLIARGQEPMAWRFLNQYLVLTGDYPGLDALAYYMVYRAMVRAKVDWIRDYQEAHAPGNRHYLDLASRLTTPSPPHLILMHGVSGAGKTWISQRLLEQLGAIRLRSDVERKRLFGLGPLDKSAGIPGGIYTDQASRQTFAHLLEQARQLVSFGFTVIVDATFLKRAHRQPFISMAHHLGVPLHILSVQAEEHLLHSRVLNRVETGEDASEATLAILEKQLGERESFTDEEMAWVIQLDGAQASETDARLASFIGSQNASPSPLVH